MIEEINDDPKNEEVSSDEGMPELEDHGQGDTNPDAGKQSKSEKKSRKAMAKLGMKPVPNVTRVCIKNSKKLLFTINNPEVFKNTSDKGPSTYIVLGQVKIDDLNQQAAGQAAEQFRHPPSSNLTGHSSTQSSTAVGGDDEGEVDPGNLDANDIELIMKQTNVSKGKAIRVLQENNGDVINAIMALTA